MQVPDIQIAAIALTLGDCVVVSENSDLREVLGLKVEDWSPPECAALYPSRLFHLSRLAFCAARGEAETKVRLLSRMSPFPDPERRGFRVTVFLCRLQPRS